MAASDQRAGEAVTTDDWIDTVIDAIPPKEWAVPVWPKDEHYVIGYVDVAAKRRLVEVIGMAFAAEVAVEETRDANRACLALDAEVMRLRAALRAFIADLARSAMGEPKSWTSYIALRKELDG